MKKRLVIAGGKGSGELAMFVFQAANEISGEWIIEGYLNDIVDVGGFLGRHKVVGTSDEVKDFVDRGYYVHYAFHFNAKQKYSRVEKFESLGIPLEANATAIHPDAIIDPDAEIGYGVMMMPRVTMSPGPKIGNFIHVYAGALLGHDCVVHDYATVTAHSIVGGRVDVGKGAHIGLNASIREDISIGEYCIIGMGSVVIRDTEDFSIVVGNPAKVIGSSR